MRQKLVLISFLIAASIAVGQSGVRDADRRDPPAIDRTAPLPPGQHRLNVRAYGARPNDPSAAAATANVRAIQGAIDHLQNSPDAEGLVYLGTGRYHLNDSLYIERKGIHLRGDGPFVTSLVGTADQGRPLLQIGVHRTGWRRGGRLVPINAAFRRDLRGVLDTSAAPARGRRFGIRTHGQAKVVWYAGPLDLGRAADGWFRSWGDVDTLTIETAFLLHGDPPTWGELLGLGSRNNPQPFNITVEHNGHLRFQFRGHDGVLYSAALGGQPRAPGLYRLTIQLDGQAGVVAAWVNGRQVSVNMLGRPVPPGTGLARREWGHFFFGGSNPWGALGGNEGFNADVTLCGLLVATEARYRVGSPGDPQRRRDGEALNDHYRYFWREAGGSHAHVPLDEPPEAGTRTSVLEQHRTVRHEGRIVLTGSRTEMPSATTVEGLTIERQGRYGASVVIADTLYPKLKDVRLLRSAYAVQILPWISTYIVKLQGVDGFGNEAFLEATNATIEATDIRLWTAKYRSAFRLRGSNLVLRDCFAENLSQTESWFWARTIGGGFGGRYLLDGVWMPNESHAAPTVAYFDVESQPAYGQIHTHLTIRNFQAATHGIRGTPGIVLRGRASHAPATLTVTDSMFGHRRGCIVEVRSPNWVGSMDNAQIAPTPFVSDSLNDHACEVVTEAMGSTGLTFRVVERDEAPAPEPDAASPAQDRSQASPRGPAPRDDRESPRR